MKLISLFSGIGAFEKALANLNIDHEVVNYCEFDKYASESYSAIHGIDKRLNLGDITKVDIASLEQGCADLITYGFPCQDISNAGKQKGFEDENGNLTRSGLFFYATAIIGRIQPRIAICENVKALTGKKFEKEFKIVLDTLDEMGYNNYWQVLNAKDYGIPQNRERVFVVSVRKDIDNGQFNFPKPFNLEKKLADLLEPEVDEKYYLSDKVSALKMKLCSSLVEQGLVEENEVIRHSYTNNRLNNGVKNMGRTESKEKLSPTLDTRCDCLGVVVKEPTKLQKEVCNQAVEKGLVKPYDVIDYTYSNARLEEMKGGKIKTKNGKDNQIANTITTVAENFGICVPDLRIRKLTPKECWRLMGFDDKDIEKAQAVGISNAQLYKQAGNSIVVNVLMELFKSLRSCNLL
jgi:DNA (cytosine-5)-methyltransferase 1